MWVEFAVSVTLLRVFFSGFSGFPPSTKTTTSKFQFDLDEGHRFVTRLPSMNKVVIIIIIIVIIIITLYNETPKPIADSFKSFLTLECAGAIHELSWVTEKCVPCSMGCKHYANEVRSRLTFKLLSIFN